MKKEYEKPYIMVESFQLNAAIAASCSSGGKIPINYGVSNCTDMGDGEPNAGYFGGACEDEGGTDVSSHPAVGGGDGNDGFCYHGPFDPSALYLKS